MALVVESTSFGTATTSDSVTVTKPAGVEVGDLLLAVFQSKNNNATSTGFSSIYSAFYDGPGGVSDCKVTVLAKIATSDDVSASNYTFTSDNVNDWMGIVTMLRVSGWISALSPNPILSSDFAGYNPTSNGTFSRSSLTLNREGQNLLIMIGAGTALVSNEYLTWPSPAPSVTSGGSNPTWTTINNSIVTVGTAGTSQQSLWVAYATTTETSDITAYQHTYVSSGSDGDQGAIGALLVINEPTDASGTNTLHSVSPTLFSNTAVEVGGIGTNALLEVSPTQFDQSGSATAPTQWTNETKGSTTWINETK